MNTSADLRPPWSTKLKRKHLLVLLIWALTIPSFAQQKATIEFSIRFYDKAIYYPNSQVFIHLELYNNSAETFRFKVSPNRPFNIEFTVRTLSNVLLEKAQKFVIDRNTNEPVLYREYSLEPGERYSIVEDLNNHIVLSDPGDYLIEAHYFPELYTQADKSNLMSNRLPLHVLPGQEDYPEMVRLDEKTGKKLEMAPLPPDEVVNYMLRARQKGDWDKFLLYIDVEELYLQDPANRRRYEFLSDEKRRAEIHQFQESLKRETTNDEFLLIPSDFEIQKTSYNPQDAYVLVVEKFQYSGFTEVKQFTYYLQRKDTIWKIFDYELKNLGTE